MFSYLINSKKTFYVKKLFNDILFLLRSGDTKEFFFLPKLGQVIIISDYYKGEGLWLLTRRYYGCLSRHDIQPRFVKKQVLLLVERSTSYSDDYWL